MMSQARRWAEEASDGGPLPEPQLLGPQQGTAWSVGGVPAGQVRSEPGAWGEAGHTAPVAGLGECGPQLPRVTPHADRHLLANPPLGPPLGGLEPWAARHPALCSLLTPVSVRHVALTLGP